MSDVIMPAPKTVHDIYKVDKHVHLQALAAGQTMLDLAQKRGLDRDTLAPGYARQSWKDLWEFHSEYERFYGRLHKDPEDYYRVCYEYLTRVAKQNTLYVELAGSLRPPTPGRISNEELMAAVGSAFHDAEKQTGIKARFIANIVRDFGPEHAEWVAREAIRLREDPWFVAGTGMSGDENCHRKDPDKNLSRYAKTYKMAKEAGLWCAAHAGETCVETLYDAIEHLGEYLDQIDHGIHALHDLNIFDQYFRQHPRHRGELINPDKPPHCVLTICYSAYKKLNSWQGPIDKLLHALWEEKGSRLLPGSDDPGPFKADIGEVYHMLHHECKFSLHQLVLMGRAGIKYSPLSDEEKKPLYVKMRRQGELLEAAQMAPVNDNRTALQRLRMPAP